MKLAAGLLLLGVFACAQEATSGFDLRATITGRLRQTERSPAHTAVTDTRRPGLSQ